MFSSVKTHCSIEDVLSWAHFNGCPLKASGKPPVLKMGVIKLRKPYTLGQPRKRGSREEIFAWARRHNCPLLAGVCAWAASEGRGEDLKWARTRGKCPWDEDVCAEAAKGGHLHVLDWAVSQGCPWDTRVCLEAARNGYLHVLDWAFCNGARWTKAMSVAAAGARKVDVLRWARAKNLATRSAEVALVAAKNGSSEVLQWYADNVKRVPKKTLDAVMMAAAEHGKPEVLDWAHRNGFSTDKSQLWLAAARKGHENVLDWAHSHGEALDDRLASEAAKQGHEGVFCWAVSRGLALMARMALEEGLSLRKTWVLTLYAGSNEEESQRLLHYAINRGLAPEEGVLAELIREGHADAVEWVYSLPGSPVGEKDWECLLELGDWKLIRVVAVGRMPPPTPRISVAAARSGNLDKLIWAVEHHAAPMVPEILYETMRGDRLDLFRWALDRGCPWEVDCETKKLFLKRHGLWDVRTEEICTAERCVETVNPDQLLCGAHMRECVRTLLSKIQEQA